MSEAPQNTPAPLSSDGLFRTPVEPERSFPTAAVTIAGVAVVVLVAVLVFFGRGGPKADPAKLQPAAAYAPNLVISAVEMSEATSLSGGKSTYIDGHIANHGAATVTGITVQVLFANDQGTASQLETVPLSLIRTRVPYVDTEPVSAEPLAPGGEADFRLIFESVNANWDQKQPEIHLIQVSMR
jgi:Protein of unknown function (DUF2393)